MLTVTEDAAGEKGMIGLPVREVLYLVYDRKLDRVIVHTAAAYYFMPGTIKYWEACLTSSGYRFLSVDRGTLLHLNSVTSVSDLYKAAYFDDIVNEKSKKCEIAHHRFTDVLTHIETINDRLQYV